MILYNIYYYDDDLSETMVVRSPPAAGQTVLSGAVGAAQTTSQVSCDHPPASPVLKYLQIT